MFIISKILLYIIMPGFWIPAILISGVLLLWTRWRRLGRWMVSIMVAFLTLLTVIPVEVWLIEILEDRFPQVRKIDYKVDGIIVLGGSVKQLVTAYRGQASLTGGAERLTEFVVLARRHREAKLVFTGGSALISHPDAKEWVTAEQFFTELGLRPGRVVFEKEARNTYENAVETFNLMKPKVGERWLLITSAMHMPRSVGVFRKAGWDPIPFPVDYETYGSEQKQLRFNLGGGLKGLSQSWREWLGLLVYRVLGRTDDFLPKPRVNAGNTR
jgi:uncharacterized SAM-binding protein YcdF (DUF218 family)